MTHQALGVLASGRGSNLKSLLDARQRGDLSIPIVLVVSDNPDAGALDIARREGVDAIHLDPGPKRSRLSSEAEGRYIDAFRSRGVTLLALAGFLRIVSPTFLAAFPDAVVNIHPSLLPAFPGLDAQRQALEHGVKVAGCTAHLVTEGIDAGPNHEQASLDVRDNETVASLSQRILELEHRIFPRAVEQVARGAWRLEGRRIIPTTATSRITSGEAS